MPRILFTGASGYIGGALFNQIKSDRPHTAGSDEIYSLVRTPYQAEQIKSLGYIPVQFDLANKEEIFRAVVDNEVTVVVHLANAFDFVPAEAFVRGLAEVKTRTGLEVHFIHTSGAKLFSSHVGIQHVSGKLLNDALDDMYTVQKESKSCHSMMNEGIETNTATLELADSLDVRSYILVPPMVCGPGDGFGNKISIQFVAIVRLGVALQHLPQIPGDEDTWALCHLQDLISLYMILLKSIINGVAPPSGKMQGYYFAENGSFSWKTLYEGIAERLASLGLLKDTTVDGNGKISLVRATEADIESAAKVLGVPPPLVAVSVAGQCSIRGDNGRQLGWEPKFGPEHLYSVVAEEVDFIIAQDKLDQKSG
ncbi:NAD-P-binding protein [Mycena rebaudengoi]|nr:NAD-P-binding protein [Mycena rebaudengoi]